jgi:hypothetical protein
MTRIQNVWLALAGVAIACGAAAACGTAAQTTGGTGATQTSGDSSGSGTTTMGEDAATGFNGSGTPTTGTSSSGTGAAGGSSGSGQPSQGASDAGTTQAAADSGATTGMVTPHMGNTCLKPGGGDYTKAGPYTVAKKAVDLGGPGGLPDAGPTTYTIFYPQPFEANCPAPIVAWGNGTGVTGSDVYAFFNNNAASWGIVVIASDNSNTGSGQYHKAGIDYLLKENQDSSSIFYQKLSTRAGVAGHSQGGIGATEGANLIGANCEAEVCVAGGGVPPKSTAFICLTGSADLAEQGCTAAYNSSQGQAFLADWDGGDHTTTETIAGYIQMQPGTFQMMRLYAAWFRCFLADDQVACKLFEGGAPKGCGICKDPGWHVLSSKNL